MSWRSASSRRSRQLERATRLRRFLSPQMAELIIDSGDESFLESHRREIVVVFCDLRQFTAFAESSEPEELMARAERVSRRARRPGLPFRGHARAVHRRRAHGGLQRSDAMRGRQLACHPHGRRDAHAGSATSPSRGRAMATTSPSVSASPRATPRSAASGSRAASSTRRSAPSSTSPPACARWRNRGRSSSRSERSSAPRTSSSSTPVGDLELRGFSRPVRAVRRQGSRHRPGAVVSTSATSRSGTADVRQPVVELDEEQRYQRFDRLQRNMPRVWDAMRLNLRERVRGGHPLGHARPPRRGQRQHDAGVRGAFPVPLAAAARATPAHGLRDVDTHRPRHHRVLPRPTPRRDPQPCPRPPDVRLRRRRHTPAAQSEAARTAPAPPPHRRPDPGPHALPPRPLQHDRARA